MHDSVIVKCRFDLIRSCCPEVKLGRLRALRLRGLSKKGCLRTVMSYSHIACLILMAMIYGDDDSILMMTYWFAWEHIL